MYMFSSSSRIWLLRVGFRPSVANTKYLLPGTINFWFAFIQVLQYTQTPVKVVKGKPGDSTQDSRQLPPDNLTCHFGFGIEALRS